MSDNRNPQIALGTEIDDTEQKPKSPITDDPYWTF
jgi:hypothetical protein